MFSKSTVKYIQSLQHKKFRDEYNAFVAEGPKVVGELLAGKYFKCRNIYALQQWASEYGIAEQFSESITIVDDHQLEKLASYSTPNMVVGEFVKKEQIIPASIRNDIFLVLDDIRDPGNLGTIIRNADWFGITHIICSNDTVDMYNPKVVQSTMASLGRVNVFYANLPEFIAANKSVNSYAAVLDGVPLNKTGKINEGIIIIGNESRGISEEVLALASHQVTIPKYGNAESLNAAVASGIILYEMVGK